MIDQADLTEDLRKLLDKELLPALRKRAEREKALDAALREEHAAAKAARRTAQAFEMWREDTLTQVGVAWVLGCVFVRFMEDNGLVDAKDHFPRIAGAGPRIAGSGSNKKYAEDQRTDYFRRHGEQTDRDYLLWVFTDLAALPACKELFSTAHNPLWAGGEGGRGLLMDADAATRLIEFFQQVDGKDEGKVGGLRYDFQDEQLSTRFLGDLYQNLSEAARKKFALLQTPVFVEEFILDRTLEPAIKEFGLCDMKGRELAAQNKPIPSDHLLRLIDPTVGSGHFLLGAFERLFAHWQRQEPMSQPAVLADRCLNSLFGVDLNPYAANIARFRLLVAALKACGTRRLREARDWTINIAVGDSLLHGAFTGSGNTGELFEAQVSTNTGNQYATSAEDLETLRTVLMPHRYHVVVGNPPYITVKDAALSEAYRRRYGSCHRKYALSVPFFERFFDLAVKGGTGFQPVSSLPAQGQEHAQDARATLDIRKGAYLPHWTKDGATYNVTFRLGDSLPQAVLKGYLAEREHIVNRAEQMGRPLSEHECKRLAELHSDKVEAYLDAGHGACHMRDERIAKLVEDALKHFDGQRYTLIAWAVMPNHVHVIVRPHAGHALPDILHSWKSFTASEANKILGKRNSGEAFWQPEYYDHLIRDAQDFAHGVKYVQDNPAAAGLKNWKWSGTGILPVSSLSKEKANDHGLEARATSAGGTAILPVSSASKDQSQDHGLEARATSAGGTAILAVSSASSSSSRQHGQDARATSAGFIGKITSNSFMKREFGSKLIETFLPRWDLTHVIDTSGAYIPGHGTPTVILFGRHRAPIGQTIRAVMGIRGEPATPEDPATAKVWTAILDQIDRPGSASEFVSVSDTARASFHSHPWSIGGGGAAELKEVLDESKESDLEDFTIAIGRGLHTGSDESYFADPGAWRRVGVAATLPLVEGDTIRDYAVTPVTETIFPYDAKLRPMTDDAALPEIRALWTTKQLLVRRREPGGTHAEIGLTWYEWSRFQRERFTAPLSIAFAFVATHNHFVLDRGGKVFNRSAPVIKLPAGASEADHLALVGLLNSAAACFWMKQVFHNKGSSVDQHGARQRTMPFEDFWEHDGTKIKQFPVPWASEGAENPLREAVVGVARDIDTLAQARAQFLPAALLAMWHGLPARDPDAGLQGQDTGRMPVPPLAATLQAARTIIQLAEMSLQPDRNDRQNSGNVSQAGRNPLQADGSTLPLTGNVLQLARSVLQLTGRQAGTDHSREWPRPGAPARRQGDPARHQGAPARHQGDPARHQGDPGNVQGAPARFHGDPGSSHGAPDSVYGAPALGHGAPDTDPGAPAQRPGGPNNDGQAARMPPGRADFDAAKAAADVILQHMIALQEELDWLVYRAYGLWHGLPARDPASDAGEDTGRMPVPLTLGQRAFEIVMARKMEAGTLNTEWFRRHGSTPITQIPAHWPADYKKVIEHRIALIEAGPKQNKDIALIEQPEYKRRWNTEKWEEMEERALREWLLDRLEWGTKTPSAEATDGAASRSSFWNEAEPQMMTAGRLADLVRSDATFMQVAGLYRSRTDFDVSDLVAELVRDESVPFLPNLRYKESGLTKRRIWERTWELQREEDRLEALRNAARAKIEAAKEAALAALPSKEAEEARNHPEVLARVLKKDAAWQAATEALDAVPANPEIDVPPRYTSADFLPGKFWSRRGKLDVPKERFVSLPHCGPDADPTTLIMWAGFDHRQQALAIATYYQDRKDNAGWDKVRFEPLLAGLLELLPWVKQWHGEPDASMGGGGTEWGAYFESFVNDEARWLGLTLDQIRAWQPPANTRGRKGKSKAAAALLAADDGEDD